MLWVLNQKGDTSSRRLSFSHPPFREGDNDSQTQVLENHNSCLKWGPALWCNSRSGASLWNRPQVSPWWSHIPARLSSLIPLSWGLNTSIPSLHHVHGNSCLRLCFWATRPDTVVFSRFFPEGGWWSNIEQQCLDLNSQPQGMPPSSLCRTIGWYHISFVVWGAFILSSLNCFLGKEMSTQRKGQKIVGAGPSQSLTGALF